jgi:hypothetical protein
MRPASSFVPPAHKLPPLILARSVGNPHEFPPIWRSSALGKLHGVGILTADFPGTVFNKNRVYFWAEFFLVAFSVRCRIFLKASASGRILEITDASEAG